MAKRVRFRPKSVGIVGAGAWGTALAAAMRRTGLETVIWGRNAAIVEEINDRHSNETYLPGAKLDPAIRATRDLAEVAARDFLLLVVPAQHLRSVVMPLSSVLAPGTPLVICCKGIEESTCKVPAGIVAEFIRGAPLPIVLSGPSFASEVVRGLPTAVVLASFDTRLGTDLMNAMGSRTFRVYLTDDTIGVQVGGAVKNVLAIAAGIVVGRGLGASAQAALITRGFHELQVFARSRGARWETLGGLSCLGDLILTCNSGQSRNFTLGRELGEGRSLAEVLQGRRSVVEGVATARVVASIAASGKIDMPICGAVYRIVTDQLSVDEAIDELLARPQRPEH